MIFDLTLTSLVEVLSHDDADVEPGHISAMALNVLEKIQPFELEI